MVVLLWTVAGILAAQLLFALWNLSGLRPLGGTGEGRRRLQGESSQVMGVGTETGSSDKVASVSVEGRRSLLSAGVGAETGSSDKAAPVSVEVQRSPSAVGRPLLSVLIPARDEAGNIGDCLRSVLAEASPALEVIVLDDQSTDGTGAIASAAAGSDVRCRVLRGASLPDGWTGKSHACSQLAAAANGQWLLFLDADARLGQNALAAAMDTALAQGGGLVTGFPYQETASWLERLVVPLMNFTIACHLPIRLVRSSMNPRFVAAHGAFLLIHRDTYSAIGGHAAFAGHLVDDMQLARAVKSAGMPVTLADISGHVSMRMYRDATGVWKGYKKNLFAGVGRSTPLLGAMLTAYLTMYVLPAVCLAWYLLDWFVFGGAGTREALSPALLPALCGWIMGLLVKHTVDRRSRHPLGYALLLTPGILALAGIALASWSASVSGRGYEWKGRRYT